MLRLNCISEIQSGFGLMCEFLLGSNMVLLQPPLFVLVTNLVIWYMENKISGKGLCMSKCLQFTDARTTQVFATE